MKYFLYLVWLIMTFIIVATIFPLIIMDVIEWKQDWFTIGRKLAGSIKIY